MSAPRATQPPWHLWGNTQTVQTVVQLGGGPIPIPNVNTLCRVAYGRPETWHWVFQARLISGPNNTAGTSMSVAVMFNVALGLGRSSIRLIGEPGTQNRPLEGLQFVIGPAGLVFPSNQMLYSTGGLSSRFFSTEAVLAPQEVSQIVAETIVCDVGVFAIADPANVAALGQLVTLEVSGQFAPVSHVRPDWYLPDVSLEEQFPGGEVPGR